MMTTLNSGSNVSCIRQRIAAASRRADYNLELLLDEIEAKEERLDERSAASGGERTWDLNELVDSVLDGTSEVVDAGDEAFVREVVKHRQDLQDESLREAVKDFLYVEHAARALNSLPPPVPQPLDSRGRM